MLISYKGQSMESQHFDGNIEKEKLENIRKEFYQEDKEGALSQLKKVLLEGKVMTNKIYEYYFERIAYDTKLWHNKWSINEVLESDVLLQVAYNRTQLNSKIYNSTESRNLRTLFRLGGKGFASKPTNFPLKECIRVLKDYSPKDGKTYIDPCSGWGIRMIASAVLGLNYVGFDVNKALVTKLNEFGNDIQSIKPGFSFKIYEQGSQYKVEELLGKGDIVFTSPPYFNLEEYGDNSLEMENSMVNYETWLSSFVEPMIQNMANYANSGTKVIFNVKDFKSYNLVKDFKSIGEKYLSFEEYDFLKIGKRQDMYARLSKGEEVCLVFNKE